MVNSEHLRKELNLTQHEMAIVLKITRSQLSLHELGLRELPTAALIKASEIGRFMATAAEPEAKHFSQVTELDVEMRKYLERALSNCQYYLEGCKRKLPKMKEKYHSALRLLQLIDYLKESAQPENALHPGALLILKNKAKNSFQKNGPEELIKLQLQLQLLQAEEVLLKDLIERSRLEK